MSFYKTVISWKRFADFAFADAEVAVAVVVEADGNFLEVVKELEAAVG